MDWADSDQRDGDAQATALPPGCNRNERNAILTMTSGYPLKKIEHLLGTFLRLAPRPNATVNCTTVFVLFATNRSVYADLLAQHPDRLLMVDTRRYLPSMRSRACGPGEHRSEVWYRWLRDDPVAKTFRHFFMIDSRDVFFQRDPFDALFAMPAYRSMMAAAPGGEFVGDGTEEFFFGAEDSVFPFFHNMVVSWTAATFNVPVLRLLEPLTVGPHHEGMPLVNSGLMFGTFGAVRDFLHIMAETITSVLETTPSGAAQWCIADQLVLTVLIGGAFGLAGYPYPVVLLNPEASPFRNLPRGEASIRFGGDDGRRVVNSRNESYAIVHQLDRFPAAWRHSHAGTGKL